uniref:Uncharacterized protein n=1 Tax=Oryza punctata TaxID=4537 RepID=A0A0E0LME9_ORYPU
MVVAPETKMIETSVVAKDDDPREGMAIAALNDAELGLGKAGKDGSPVKIQKQDDFTSFKIEKLIQSCKFYANMSNSKRNTIPANMLKNARRQEVFGVLDLIFQAQKDDKFFANLAVKLKCLLETSSYHRDETVNYTNVLPMDSQRKLEASVTKDL